MSEACHYESRAPSALFNPDLMFPYAPSSLMVEPPEKATLFSIVFVNDFY